MGAGQFVQHCPMSTPEWLTQRKIADEPHIGSKLERHTDMYVSTLASHLQAVGADLEIGGDSRGVSRWACREDHTVFGVAD
jgi:hypothetical protein